VVRWETVDVVAGVQVVTVAAVVAAIGGVVAAVATVIRLLWDRSDRRRAAEERRPKIRTYTRSQMRDILDQVPWPGSKLDSAPIFGTFVMLALLVILVMLAIYLQSGSAGTPGLPQERPP
jgi:hypothetical protein